MILISTVIFISICTCLQPLLHLNFGNSKEKMCDIAAFLFIGKMGAKKKLKFFIKINGMITVNCTKVFLYNQYYSCGVPINCV